MRSSLILASFSLLLLLPPEVAEAQRRPRRTVRHHRVVRPDGAAQARREVKRARAEAARTVVRRGGRAAALVDSARHLIARADRALRVDQPKRARDLAYRAQRLLTRAQDADRRARGRDAQVSGQLDELDRHIARARRVARHGAPPRAAKLVRLARGPALGEAPPASGQPRRARGHRARGALTALVGACRP